MTEPNNQAPNIGIEEPLIEDKELVDAPNPNEECCPEVEYQGVTYKLDEEGNYTLGGVPVLDSRRVPVFNRVKEYERKLNELNVKHEKELFDLESRMKNEIAGIQQQQQTEAVDLDAYDEETGMTNRQIFGLEKKLRTKIMQELQQERSNNAVTTSNILVEQKIEQLKQLPKYRDYFANLNIEGELRERMSRMNPETKVAYPNIVEDALKLIIGDHLEEVNKIADSRATRSNQGHKEYVGNIASPSAGAGYGAKSSPYPVTPEAYEYADQTGLPIEEAAKLVYKRKSRSKKGD